MDVNGTTPLPSAGAQRAVRSAAPPATHRPPATAARATDAGPDAAVTGERIGALLAELAGPEFRGTATTRLQIDIDQDAGRVYGRLVDRNTGEAVVEIPTKEMRALLARAREMFGPLFDVKA